MRQCVLQLVCCIVVCSSILRLKWACNALGVWDADQNNWYKYSFIAFAIQTTVTIVSSQSFSNEKRKTFQSQQNEKQKKNAKWTKERKSKQIFKSCHFWEIHRWIPVPDKRQTKHRTIPIAIKLRSKVNEALLSGVFNHLIFAFDGSIFGAHITSASIHNYESFGSLMIICRYSDLMVNIHLYKYK